MNTIKKIRKPGYNVQLPVVLFKEENVFIVYCPALDLSASGKTDSQAKSNFSQVVDMYMEYTMNKGTLHTDLKKLGWTINKKKKQVASPPTMSELLEKNEEFTRIFDNFSYEKFDTGVSLPANA